MHDYGVRSLFRPGFEDLHLRFYQLDRLMEEQLPELYQHLVALGVETHMFCSHWFLTLFTAKFPLHLVFYILDLFLYNRFNTIFQVSIALLSISQTDLLKLDFEGVLKYFRVYLPKKYGTDANAKFLLKTAFNVKVKKLDKFEKDYAQFKEAKQDPVQRLTKENQRLQSSVLRLEQENDNLATEISIGKLALRKQLDISEDKVDHLNNELARQNKYLSELEEEKKLLSDQVSSRAFSRSLHDHSFEIEFLSLLISLQPHRSANCKSCADASWAAWRPGPAKMNASVSSTRGFVVNFRRDSRKRRHSTKSLKPRLAPVRSAVSSSRKASRTTTRRADRCWKIFAVVRRARK